MLNSILSETRKAVTVLERIEAFDDLVTDIHVSNEVEDTKFHYDSFGNTIKHETSTDFDDSSSLYDDCESDDEFSGKRT